MIYKKFQDLEISTLGMGNMRLPMDKGGNIDENPAREIIEYAYNNGINYFDTAYRYHGGASETFVGEVLKQYPRDTWYLASKMPGHMMNYKDDKLGFVGYLAGEKIESISQIFEEQLEKCQVDYFDFYLLHNVCETSFDFYTNEELDVVGYLLEQKKAGRIRHLGFSAHGRDDIIEKFLDKYPDIFEFAQIQINYLDWDLQGADKKYNLLTKRGIPVIAMEPVRGGKLIDLNPQAEEILKSANTGETNASWAFRFLKDLPNMQIVLSGMSTMEQLKENIDIFSKQDAHMTDAEHELLKKVVATMVDSLPCTECRYCCEECPQNLDIPKLLSVYEEAKFSGLGILNFNIGNMTDDELPSACISCGACSKVCPQSIKIPEILSELNDILEAAKK